MLNDSHIAQLEASGLTSEHIQLMVDFGWKSVDTKEATELVGQDDSNSRSSSGLAIPFEMPVGANTEVRGYRIRLDKENTYERDGKECHQKYSQGRNTILPPYIPCNVDANQFGPTSTVYLCEGEKKAEAVAMLGFEALGLTGVSSWSQDNDGVRSLKTDLVDLLKPVSGVCIVYDNDINNPKKDSLAELVRLAKALVASGKTVSWVPLANGPKGIDDVLAVTGQDATKKLLSAALPSNPNTLLEARYRVDSALLARYGQMWFGNGKKGKAWADKAQQAGKITEVPFSGTDVLAHVSKFIDEGGYKYSYRAEGVIKDGATISSDELQDIILLDAIKYSVAQVKSVPIKAAWNVYRKQKDIETRQSTLEALTRPVGAAPDDSHLRRWVQAVTGDIRPLDLAVIKHFVWQVKRKMSGLPVREHMMPIVFGATGGGKSESIKALIRPLGEVCDTPGSFDILADERQFFRLERNYVMFFDEMGKSTTADVACIKNAITMERASARVLGSNRSNGAPPNNATFIGGSNVPVNELINDPTSARRFWQINAHVQSQADYAVINSIDYAALWQSVSQTDVCPIQVYLAELRKIQHTELRAKTIIEEWIADRCTVGGKTSAQQLYDSFCGWFQRMNRRTLMPTFTKFCKELGGLVQKHKASTISYGLTIGDLPGETQAPLAN